MSAAAQVLRQAEALKASISDSAKGISETWVARQRLEDLYKKLLLMDLEYALDKKVEQELWNHAFKNHINELQSQAKDKQNPKRGEVQATLSLFLETASGFYLQLLQLICTTFKLDLPFRRKSSCLGIMKEKISTKIKITPPKKSSCLYFCQHCLVHLGDIARYRQQIEQAQTYYWHAANLVPFNGQPYNQLAIVEAARGNKLSTVFYYIRSLAVRHPFPVAATNLEKLYAKISRDSCEFKGKLSVSEMITAFLQFQAFVHLCCELDKASFLSEKLLQALPAHVTSQSFPSHILIQIVAINIFAMQHARRQMGGENDDIDDSADQLTTDEERAFSLMLLFTISILDVLLQYTPKHDHKLREFFTLPSVKLLLDWFRLNPAHLSNPVVKTSGLWINLCKVLNNIKPPQTKKEEPIDLSKYEELPLPEDTELRCFQPLEKAQSGYSYSRLPSDGLPQEVECHLRCQRILGHGKWIAEEYSNLNLLLMQIVKGQNPQFSSPVVPSKSNIGLNKGSSLSPEKKSRQNVAIQAIIQKQTERKELKPSRSQEKIKIATTTVEKTPSIDTQTLGPASPKYLLGTPTNQPEFMKSTTSTKPTNSNIPPRLQQQPPRLQKQMLAQQQARQQSQEKVLWEPDSDTPPPPRKSASFEGPHPSTSGTAIWEQESGSQSDNVWKPQSSIVWDPDSDTPQRQPLSQPAKLWEPKTGKFKIVETTESHSQRSSNIHAWASPQQEVSKPQQLPQSHAGQPEQQVAPQSQGQSTQPLNQFLMFRPDFRQPPPNLPPPPPGPPGPLQRMMGFSQPPMKSQGPERSMRGEDPLMSLRGPPEATVGSNMPLGRPPPPMEGFSSAKMAMHQNFPPPPTTGNLKQNQSQDKALEIGMNNQMEKNPHSQFLNFTNFPPPPPPLSGQFGGKDNSMLFPPQQGMNFPRFPSNPPPKEMFNSGAGQPDLLNKNLGNEPVNQLHNTLFNFPPAPGTERMSVNPTGTPNIRQPPPSQPPQSSQPPPNFNMLNPNFLSSGRFPIPRGGIPPQTEAQKLINGDYGHLMENVTSLSHLAIQPPKSSPDLFPVSPRMGHSFQGHAEGTPKPDSGNSPSRSPHQPNIDSDMNGPQVKPLATTSAPIQQGTYSLFSGTTWSVPLSSADTKSIGSSPFSSESSSIRNSPDVSETFTESKISSGIDLGLRFGPQEDHWREMVHQGQVMEQMANNGQGGNFFQGNIQSIWSSSSSGPSPLERLLEKQKQRQNDPH